MSTRRYHVFVDGRVQGVGFRGTCRMIADELHLSGRVRNLSNGMVEIFIQGEERNCDQFLAEIQKPDRWIRVTDISVKEMPVEPDEKRFTCDYGESWY